MTDAYIKQNVFDGLPHEGDLAVRSLRTDRYEVSAYDSKTNEWRDQATVSLAELNRFVRTQKFLGRHGDWEFYRK